MKFLIDQDVPEDLTYLLRELAHEVLYVREILSPGAADIAVLECARDNDCVVMTCNRDDYLNLAESQPHSGIIVIIRRRTRATSALLCCD